MAVAAATAVIAPAAFLAAPAAYATDGTTGTTETVSDDENPPPPADGEVVPPPADDTVEPPPVDDDVVPPPVDDENPPPPVDPPVNPPVDDTVVPPPVDEGENPEPGDDEGEEEEEEEEPTPPDEECADGDFKSTLSGLPSKIVAGSGWKEFSLNLDNKNGDDVATIVLGAVVLYKKDAQDSFESDLTSKYAKFEYFDGKKWVNDDLSDGGSFAGELDVEAGETYSLKLRMNVSAKAPAGAAVAIAFAVSVDDDLNCYVDEKWYSFEVLAADSTPGSVPPAEPEDGKSPADIKPQGGAKALPAAANGSLAETGSNSALPAVGIAAALAVAVGGGVVFALRRREGDAVA
ncbi:LAETG motif-containing sortase-dependent surface protein [Streptomyces niveus]|uniref:LAETG motif-containing sortase-dependent surface protein n=1 Tax=Streptomyces niveus TaxID=193462 RepID=UPI003633E349